MRSRATPCSASHFAWDVDPKLLPGMVLANDVFSYDSNIRLLDKGTVLDEKDIARLAFYSIIDVLIEEDPVENVALTSPDNAGLTYSERLKQSKEFKEFKHDFEECASRFEHTIGDILKGNQDLDLDEMMTPIYSLLGKGRTASNIFDMLHNLRLYDDATFTHCINVGLITNVLAHLIDHEHNMMIIALFINVFLNALCKIFYAYTIWLRSFFAPVSGSRLAHKIYLDQCLNHIILNEVKLMTG